MAAGTFLGWKDYTFGSNHFSLLCFPAVHFMYIYKNSTFPDIIGHLETRDRMGKQLGTIVALGNAEALNSLVEDMLK